MVSSIGGGETGTTMRLIGSLSSNRSFGSCGTRSVGLRRRQRAAATDKRNIVEWRNDRRLEASVVRRLTPNRLFALRGPPTGWSEHRRERLSGLNKPALFSCE